MKFNCVNSRKNHPFFSLKKFLYIDNKLFYFEIWVGDFFDCSDVYTKIKRLNEKLLYLKLFTFLESGRLQNKGKVGKKWLLVWLEETSVTH